MHIIGVRNANPPIAEDRLDGTEPRVEPQGEELRTQGIALASPTARGNDEGRVIVTPHVHLRRATIVSESPKPEIREGGSHHTQELSTMDGVEGVGDIQSSIHPVRVQIEGR